MPATLSAEIINLPSLAFTDISIRRLKLPPGKD